MHRDDPEMMGMLNRLEVPPPSPDLSERIIAHAVATGHARQQDRPQGMVKSGRGFSGWWAQMRAEHGQKMAVAAALAAIAIIVFDPAGKVTKHYVETQQVAQNAQASERYTIDGMPLLIDVAMMDEPDLQLEEVVVFNDQG